MQGAGDTELRNLSLELRNVSLELRNVGLELRNVRGRAYVLSLHIPTGPPLGPVPATTKLTGTHKPQQPRRSERTRSERARSERLRRQEAGRGAQPSLCDAVCIWRALQGGSVYIDTCTAGCARCTVCSADTAALMEIARHQCVSCSFVAIGSSVINSLRCAV
jgi:hypothetical protein